MRIPAVVLSVDVTGLGAVRSLAREGIPVTTVVTDPAQPAYHSRYGRKVLVPPSDTPEAALLDTLLRVADEGSVILPTSDEFVRFLAAHRALLESRFRLCLPSSALLDFLTDKARETALVARCGIAMPRTVQDIPETPEALIAALGLPLILKPRSSAHRRAIRKKNVVIRTEEELRAFYAAFGSARSSLIAQEHIPGDDSTLWVCDATFDAGSNLVSAFTFRKVRTAPPHDGVTCFGRSERNADLVALTGTVGTRLGYIGPADIDVKFDVRDGQFKYLEINPRLGMCNAFAAGCGVNVALHAYLVAAEGSLPTAPPAQVEGPVYINLFDDLVNRYMDRAPLRACLREYASSLGRKKFGAYFTWTDPWPAVRIGWRQLGMVARGVMARLSRRPPRPSPSSPALLGQ
jgi:predicted ATP-grasp superfamily ATP-dependent carboligase